MFVRCMNFARGMLLGAYHLVCGCCFTLSVKIFLHRRQTPGPGGAGSAQQPRVGGLGGLLFSFIMFEYLFFLIKNVCLLLDLGCSRSFNVLSSDPAGRGPKMLAPGRGRLKFPRDLLPQWLIMHVSLEHQIYPGYAGMRLPRHLRLLLYVASEIFLRRRRPPPGPGGAGSAQLPRGGGLGGFVF